MKSVFDVEEHFFCFDSDSLDSVVTRMYGYAVTSQPVPSTSPSDSASRAAIDGCGTYVLVEREGDSITIRQDFLGDFGLFVYRDGDYFAVSNSFFMLVDSVRDSHPLGYNDDYIHQYLSTWIVSLAYSATAVSEIERVASHAVLHIDIASKSLSISHIDYGFNSVPIRSAEGIAELDRWHAKWISVVRWVCESTPNVRIDLSGGFDSRIAFLFLVESGVGLAGRWVYSMRDNLHTHEEDYRIASEIAERYGFNLNDASSVDNEAVNFPLDDILGLELHTKALFQKELKHPASMFVERHYGIGGSGGETVRPYWDSPPAEFLEHQSRFAYGHRWALVRRIQEACNRVIGDSFSAIERKYAITDPESHMLAFNMFRECYSRNHFGKGNVLSVICNSFGLSPLLDPALHKLQLEDDRCRDKNLLYAVVFTRYCRELLDFDFDGGRAFDAATLAYAEQVNAEFPFPVENPLESVADGGYIVCDIPSRLDADVSDGRHVSRQKVDEFYFNAFASPRLRDVFSSRFDPDYLRAAFDQAKNGAYFPLRHVYAIVGVAELMQRVEGDDDAFLSSAFLDRLQKNGQDAGRLADEIGGASKRSAARIDVSQQGTSESFEVVSLSDADAFLTKPDWFNKGQLGYVIEPGAGVLDATVRVNAPGRLRVVLRSRDMRDGDGVRLHNPVHYRSFVVGGIERLTGPSWHWHDDPFAIEIEVSTGDIVDFHVKWDT